jgi:heptosyltransferase-2
MGRCKVVVSNDTGPMHLAYAAGTPVVALFSSRDYPEHWFPPENSGNTTLRLYDVHCSICLSDTCTNNICMKRITPDEVIQKLLPYLE